MRRIVISLIIGYMTLTLLLSVSFIAAALMLGVDRVFVAGSYDPSPLWIGISIMLSFVAAITSGALCRVISKDEKGPVALICLIMAFGFVLAMRAGQESGNSLPKPRGAQVKFQEAMQNAREPVWLAFLNPIVGAAGIYLGSWLRRPR